MSGGITGYRAAGQGNLRRNGEGTWRTTRIFTAAPGQGLVVSTGILGDLVLPDGTFDPDRADEIRDLAAQAAVYATQARGPGTLRAYRSAWRQYDAWCVRLGLPALSADPRLVGMYLTAAAERLAVATLQVHLAAIVTAHRLVGLSLDPGHPSIALLMDGIRRRRGTRPARQATPITPAMLARMVRAQPATPLGLRNRAILLAGFGGALRRSEIVGLDAGDLEFVEGRGVVLTVRRSKTDQHGAGQAVAVWRSDDPDLCAPTALRRWLEHRDAHHSDDPLFVGLRVGGVMTATRLSDKAVVRLVKDTAEAVGDADPGLMERTFGSLACQRPALLLGPQPARRPRHRGGRGGGPAPRRHAPDPPQVGRGRPPLHALRRPVAQQRHREGHAPNLRTGTAVRPPKQSWDRREMKTRL